MPHIASPPPKTLSNVNRRLPLKVPLQPPVPRTSTQRKLLIHQPQPQMHKPLAYLPLLTAFSRPAHRAPALRLTGLFQVPVGGCQGRIRPAGVPSASLPGTHRPIGTPSAVSFWTKGPLVRSTIDLRPKVLALGGPVLGVVVSLGGIG